MFHFWKWGEMGGHHGPETGTHLVFFLWLFGTAFAAEGVIEVKGVRRFDDPGVGAVGAAALQADLDALKLALGEGLVDAVSPVGGDFERPG